MAAEAAVFIVGWVRLAAARSRRIVVATFLIYNLDAMPVPIACFARRARGFGLGACLPYLSIVPLAPISMVPPVKSFSQPRLLDAVFGAPRGPLTQPGGSTASRVASSAVPEKSASPEPL